MIVLEEGNTAPFASEVFYFQYIIAWKFGSANIKHKNGRE